MTNTHNGHQKFELEQIIQTSPKVNEANSDCWYDGSIDGSTWRKA